MKFVKQKKGQFIIIAALTVTIMIVSVGAIMYGAITYFKPERWEEYLAVIDNIKMGSYRVVEISLANYTKTMNSTMLGDYLNQWQGDLKKAYPGFGIVLAYTLATGVCNAYGENIIYSLGLANHWYDATSFSGANSTFMVNITSVGLAGYKFMTPVFLRMRILDALWYDSLGQVGIRLFIDKEGPTPITDLQSASFEELVANDTSKDFTLYQYYDSETYDSFVYELRYESGSKVKPLSITFMVTVVDTRSITVTGNATLPVITAT